MIDVFCSRPLFAEIRELIVDYAAAARQIAETMKKDPRIFDVWPNFVALGELLDDYSPEIPADADKVLQMRIAYSRNLIKDGRRLIGFIAGARVPMLESTAAYIENCQRFARAELP